MIFFNSVFAFFKNIFSKEMILFTLTVLISILIFFNINTCNKLKIEKQSREQDKMIYNQNFEAYIDTIRVSYNEKLKAYEYDKKAYLTTLDELKKYDSSLSIKLNKVKGDIINAINSKLIINVGNVEVDNNLKTYDNDIYGLKWNYNYIDDGFSQYLSGVSKFKLINNKIFANKTIIDTNLMILNISYGFRELDDKYQVWAISASPKVNINELSGAYFIDKPPPYNSVDFYQKRWIIGPYIGYGVNFNNNFQDPRLGLNFGISIQYNLFGFGKKLKKTKNQKSNISNKINNLIN